PALTQLQDVLAELFDSADRIGMILDEAGVPRARIQLSLAPLYAWHNALLEADRQRLVEAIIEAAVRHYSTHQPLREAADLYHRSTETTPGGVEQPTRADAVGGAAHHPLLDAGRIANAFQAASAPLLNWQTTLDNGRWLDRSELQPLVASLDSP